MLVVVLATPVVVEWTVVDAIVASFDETLLAPARLVGVDTDTAPGLEHAEAAMANIAPKNTRGIKVANGIVFDKYDVSELRHLIWTPCP